MQRATFIASIRHHGLPSIKSSREGTHRGPLGNMPATGKSVVVPWVLISRFDGEKIVEEWEVLRRVGSDAATRGRPRGNVTTVLLNASAGGGHTRIR
jgi:hypothetical protein